MIYPNNHRPTPKFVKVVHSLACLAGLLLPATACNTNSVEEEFAPSHEITFLAHQPDPVSRSSSQLKDGDSFGILAYNCPDNTFHDDSSTPDLLYNAWVEKFTSEGVLHGFRYIPTVHWPASGKVRFIAYYPHNSSLAQGAITVSPFTLTGLPKFEVELGREKKSVDFSIADVGPIQRRQGIDDPIGTPVRTDNNVSFAFKRRMSYIQFRCKAVNMPDTLTRIFINRITLRNIYRRGTYNMAANSGAGAWENLGLDATTGATLNLSSTSAPVSTTDFKDLIDPNGIGYLISIFPQSYDNVEMMVTYTLEYRKAEGGCEYQIIGTKRLPLTANWTIGKLSIYDIEFAFDEAFGENILFNFKVKQWTNQTIDTSM